MTGTPRVAGKRTLEEPAEPSPAAAARTIVTAAGSLTVRWATGRADVVAGHRADASGRVVLGVDVDGSLARAARAARAAGTAGLPAVLELADAAPVPTRDRVRARLSLRGWLAPDPRSGSPRRTTLRLDLAEVTLLRLRSLARVGLDEYATAVPDVLAGVEAELLAHLYAEHEDLVVLLSRLVPPDKLLGAVRVLPHALDAHGLVLRVERLRSHGDVRLAFPRILRAPEDAGPALRWLVAAAQRQPRPCRAR